MLEIAILTSVAAIFVILAVRFPKTGNFSFFKMGKKKEDGAIAEAKKILDERHERHEEIIDTPEPEEIEPEDELDGYDIEISELLKEAREKIENGKYSSAEEILIDAICKDNKCAWAYERLGSIYLAIGKNYSDARESFSMAAKIDQNNDRAWFGLGQIDLIEGQLHQAINNFTKAVNISRANAEYQAALGKAYMEVRQYGKAAKALKRASSLDISNMEYKQLSSLAEDKHREHSRASKLS